MIHVPPFRIEIPADIYLRIIQLPQVPLGRLTFKATVSVSIESDTYTLTSSGGKEDGSSELVGVGTIQHIYFNFEEVLIDETV